MAPTIKLGALLVKAKVLDETQVKAALNEQAKWGGKLGEVMVRMALITEEMLVKALAKQLSVAAVDLAAIDSVPPHVLAKLGREVAKDLNVLPLQLRDESKTLVVAMADPQNLRTLDTLRSVTRCKIVPQVAGRNAIARAFGRFYEGEAEVPPIDVEGSFKFVDAQGKTIIRHTPAGLGARDTPSAAAPARSPSAPEVRANRSAGEALSGIEEAQKNEVAALKAMVELLIEKGVFSREEYLAKVKRDS